MRNQKKKSPEQDYLEVNRSAWNNKVAIHTESDFYDLTGFKAGNTSLNAIELDLLGDLRGQSLLHLQCHFGQDTLSLARLGAKAIGVDFSEKAIERAKSLAQDLSLAADFICSDVYSLPQHLQSQFDVVFSSYGTIGWLPDLKRWAEVVAHFLKPGGRFIFAEFHPVVWMFDDDFQEIAYPYFKKEAIVETYSGTYAQPDADIQQKSITWNHGLSEVLGNLLGQGLELRQFKEYDYSPYNCFRHTVEIAPKQFRIKHLADKIPMVYALEMHKPIH